MAPSNRTQRIARQPPALTRRHVACTQVVLEAMLLKPSMVLPGLDASLAENDQEEVARLTVQTMMRSVPPAVPGIHFLSGGMGAEEATQNLQLLQRACPSSPWSLSFSFGRALQDAVLKAWAGEADNVRAARPPAERRCRVLVRQAAHCPKRALFGRCPSPRLCCLSSRA